MLSSLPARSSRSRGERRPPAIRIWCEPTSEPPLGVEQAPTQASTFASLEGQSHVDCDCWPVKARERQPPLRRSPSLSPADRESSCHPRSQLSPHSAISAYIQIVMAINLHVAHCATAALDCPPLPSHPCTPSTNSVTIDGSHRIRGTGIILL